MSVTLPPPLRAYTRKAFNEWLKRCADAHNVALGDWMKPTVDLDIITVDKKGSANEFKMPPGSWVSKAAVVVAAVRAGIEHLGPEYEISGTTMVDAVLRAAGGLPLAVGVNTGEEFRSALLEIVIAGLAPRWEKLRTMSGMCTDLLEEAGLLNPEYVTVRNLDSLDGVADEILENGTGENHLASAPKGNGKTKFVLTPIAKQVRYAIVASHRTTLTELHLSALDCDHYKHTIEKKQISLPGVTAYCVHSFKKKEALDLIRAVDCVIFDEFHGIMEAIAKGPGKQGGGMQHPGKVYDAVKGTLFDRTKTVVMMDAGITHKDAIFVILCSMQAGKKVNLWIVQGDQESKNRAHEEAVMLGRGASNRKHVVVLHDELVQEAAIESEHIAHSDKVILYGSTSDRSHRISHDHLSHLDDANVYLSAQTKDEPMILDLLTDPNGFVERHAFWLFSMTPAGAEGMSLESLRFHTTVFLNYTSNLNVTYQTVDQMSARGRGADTIWLCITRGGRDDKWTGACDHEVVIENIRLAAEANYAIQGESLSIGKLDNYTNFAAWYLEDIEYSRIYGKQLLFMKWTNDGYNFEYTDEEADAREAEARSLQDAISGAADRDEMGAAPNIRSEDVESLIEERRLFTTKMGYSTAKRLLAGSMALSVAGPYVRVEGVPEEDYEAQMETDRKFRDAKGSLLLNAITAEDILKMKQELGFSSAKLSLLSNAIWGYKGTNDPREADIDKRRWPLRHEISRRGFALLRLDPLTGEGEATWADLEAFKAYMIPSIRQAHGCGMMKGVNGIYGSTIDKYKNIVPVLDTESMTGTLKSNLMAKKFLANHGLKLIKHRRGGWAIDQRLHGWMIDIFDRRRIKSNLDAIDAFGEAIGEGVQDEVITSVVSVAPVIRTPAAKFTSDIILAADGVVPLTAKAIMRISCESDKMKSLVIRSAGERKRQLKLAEDIHNDLGLEISSWEVKGGDFGATAKPDQVVPVLVVKGADTAEVGLRVRGFFNADSAELVR